MQPALDSPNNLWSADTVIVWDHTKFKLHLQLTVDDKSTLAILQHRETSAVISVASAHLHGLDLRIAKFNKVVDYTVAPGDTQLRTIKEELDKHNAHLRIVGMDSNVTSEIYQPRLDILEEADYKRNTHNGEASPTIIDANLKTPEEIDFVYGQTDKEQYTLQIEEGEVPDALYTLAIPNGTNPSDHRPVVTKFTLTALHAG
jgi:hypothetical protein